MKQEIIDRYDKELEYAEKNLIEAQVRQSHAALMRTIVRDYYGDFLDFLDKSNIKYSLRESNLGSKKSQKGFIRLQAEWGHEIHLSTECNKITLIQETSLENLYENDVKREEANLARYNALAAELAKIFPNVSKVGELVFGQAKTYSKWGYFREGCLLILNRSRNRSAVELKISLAKRRLEMFREFHRERIENNKKSQAAYDRLKEVVLSAWVTAK